jgi:hypothetical protein
VGLNPLAEDLLRAFEPVKRNEITVAEAVARTLNWNDKIRTESYDKVIDETVGSLHRL